MWNGMFSPRLTKGNEWDGHFANPKYELVAEELAESAGGMYAYISVEFNHGPESVPSNDTIYAYQIDLPPGMTTNELVEMMNSSVKSDREKLAFLDEHSVPIIGNDAIERMHSRINNLRAQAGLERIQFGLEGYTVD